MVIQENDYRDILQYFKKMYDKGERYIAYEDNSQPVDARSLPTFRTHFGAMEFCYECTTDINRMSFLSIESAYKAMLAAIDDPSLLVRIRTNQDIDISLTTIFYSERVEREHSQIAKNNYISHENPNNKEKQGEDKLQIAKEGQIPQQNDKQKEIRPMGKETRTTQRKNKGFGSQRGRSM